MAPLNEESVQEVAVTEPEQVELTPEQKTEKLAQLMADGKRELRANNYQDASEKFGEAAEFCATNYGEFAVESFEPNFMYGRALVELSTVENDIFQNALVNMAKKKEEEGEGATAEEEEINADESMTEEEKEDVREMVADALAENAQELEKKEGEEEKKEEEVKEEGEKKEEETTEEETKVEETKEEEKKEEPAAEASTAEEKKEEEASTEEEKEGEKMEEGEGEEEKEDIGEENGEEDAEDEEEELESAQLAWEALEVAAKISERLLEETKSDEWRRKRADVFVQLAQCNVNDEKYEEALEDLGKARALLEESETLKKDRLNAEVHFHEGRINRLRNEFELAAAAFEKGAAAMEETMAVLKASAGDAPSEEQKEDLADMEGVIRDFRERAEDSKQSAVQKKMMEELAEKEKQPAVLTTSNGQTDSAANDITGMVRKKRTLDETTEEDASLAKKSKSEEVEEKGEENIAV